MKKRTIMKWIYKYLDGAMNETDIGFFDTEEEAQFASDKHHSFGAITTGAIEVSDDYELYKPKYD